MCSAIHKDWSISDIQEEATSAGCTIDEVLVVGDDMAAFKDAVTLFDCGVSV